MILKLLKKPEGCTNGVKEHGAKHTLRRYKPCELCGEGAKNVRKCPQTEYTLIRCESCRKTDRSSNGINDHEAEHTAIRCDPCELCDE